jgi:hypothetical protein
LLKIGRLSSQISDEHNIFFLGTLFNSKTPMEIDIEEVSDFDGGGRC